METKLPMSDVSPDDLISSAELSALLGRFSKTCQEQVKVGMCNRGSDWSTRV